MKRLSLRAQGTSSVDLFKVSCQTELLVGIQTQITNEMTNTSCMGWLENMHPILGD